MMASYTSLHARHLSEHSKQAFLGYDNDCFLFWPYVLLLHLGLRSQPSYGLTSPERPALRGHEHQEYSSCYDREGECAQRSKDRPTVGKVNARGSADGPSQRPTTRHDEDPPESFRTRLS